MMPAMTQLHEGSEESLSEIPNALRLIANNLKQAIDEGDMLYVESVIEELQDIADVVNHITDPNVRMMHHRPRRFLPKKPPPKYHDQG